MEVGREVGGPGRGGDAAEEPGEDRIGGEDGGKEGGGSGQAF